MLAKKKRAPSRSLPPADGIWSGSSLACFAATLAICAWVYAPVAGFHFVNWDDGSYVAANPQVLKGITWDGFVWSLSAHEPYWHPLTWWSHMLDVEMFGADPGAHHVINLIIHLSNTVLVAWIVASLTKRPWRALTVAAAFAVHPLHVESVAWIAERKDLLSTLFMLMAAMAYARYVKTRSRADYGTLIVCFIASLMAKPMFVTLPVLLLILDWWPLRRDFRVNLRALVLEKVPLLIVAAIVSVETFIAQSQVGTMASVGHLPVWARASHAAISYTTYLWQSVWPANLAAFYPYPTSAPGPGITAAAIFLLLAITGLVFRFRSRPYLLFGWLWFLVSLTPVIGFVQVGNQASADRFMYAPVIGLLVAFVWGVADLAERLKAPRVAVATVAAVLVATAGAAARAQVMHWADSETLWTRALAVSPDSFYAHSALGQALAERGAWDLARAQQEEALRLQPSDPDANNELGVSLARSAQWNQAIAHFTRALAASPQFVEARRNLARAHYDQGSAMAEKGDLAAALPELEAAVANDVERPDFRVTLAVLLIRLGRVQEARPHVLAAIALDPGNTRLNELLAMVGGRRP